LPCLSLMCIELTHALVFRCVVPRHHLVSLSLMCIELTHALVFRCVVPRHHLVSLSLMCIELTHALVFITKSLASQKLGPEFFSTAVYVISSY
jgi:hypothetical protein